MFCKKCKGYCEHSDLIQQFCCICSMVPDPCEICLRRYNNLPFEKQKTLEKEYTEKELNTMSENEKKKRKMVSKQPPIIKLADINPVHYRHFKTATGDNKDNDLIEEAKMECEASIRLYSETELTHEVKEAGFVELKMTFKGDTKNIEAVMSYLRLHAKGANQVFGISFEKNEQTQLMDFVPMVPFKEEDE